jgi:group I intron endonuclease
MKGIYKITSPSGNVYIGQSVNIRRRWSYYRSNKAPGQTSLHRSFLKYGVNSHSFEIVHELPKDASLEVMDAYEILYWECYKNCGVTMLNLREPGMSGRHTSEETLVKLRENRKKQVFGPESYEKMAAKRRRVKMPPEFGLKVSLTKASFSEEKWKGISKKISASKVGKKQPPSFAINMSKSTKGIKIVPQWQLDICHQAVRRPVNKLSILGEFIELFSSITEAAIAVGVKPSNISACLSGKTKNSGGFKWEYVK